LIQSPIHKALSTFRNSSAQFLLMGGQACILYGGAEFSRDIDLSIGEIGLLSLPDLVCAKKTQREKDWPMIRRLVETDISANLAQADEPRIVFWLEECRTPILLSALAKNHPTLCKRVMTRRALLETAITGDLVVLEDLLHNEEKAEREIDRMYWQPLRMELEQWRRQCKEQGA